MDITSAFKIIEENIELSDFTGNIEDISIQKAELILGLNFPESYKSFLKVYGCGDIFGIEIFGIISDEDINGNGIPAVVWLTKELRKNELDNNLVPVSETGDGSYYVLDTSAFNRNECPVLIWDEGNLETEKVAENFGVFLFQRLNESQE